jgi:2-keto-4-pentenoate hydratase
MRQAERQSIAATLAEAEASRQAIDPITITYPDLAPADAYEIQLINIRQRMADGARIVGHKVGLTSWAMQRLMGVNEPDYGHLLDDMMRVSGDAISAGELCQPRVEVEIAFVLKDALRGPDCTDEDVIRATDHVVAAIEVIASRIKDWKLTLPDTIADNASSGLVVLGAHPLDLAEIDIRLNGVLLKKNGQIVETGAAGAVLGNPVTAVAWLANTLHRFDTVLEPGHVIMPGSCTAAVAVEPGDVIEAEFDRLGSVTTTFI